MSSNDPNTPADRKPAPPDIPDYLVDALEARSPPELEHVATFAVELAEWKRTTSTAEEARRRKAESISDEEVEALEERGVSVDPDDYDDVPASGAYITTKTTKSTPEKDYRYYYWQWRDGDTFQNEYIAPVNPSSDS